MSLDYGIKVTKPGYAIDTTDIRNIIMSSKYPQLKIFSDTTTSLTFHPGDVTEYVDITHNLGYVPAHLIIWKDEANKEWVLPFYPRGIEVPSAVTAYADTTKIRITEEFFYGWNLIELTQWLEGCTDDGDNSNIRIGKKDGSSKTGAIRYEYVGSGFFGFGNSLPQGASIDSATLDFYMQEVGRRTPTQDMVIMTVGIDEDDCGSVIGNFGRSTTSADMGQNVAAGTVGEYFGINIKDIVQEIVNRGGWADNHHMGFYIYDDGTPDGEWRRDTSSTPDTKLIIKKSGNLTHNFRVIIFSDKIA